VAAGAVARGGICVAASCCVGTAAIAGI
jgi:hypothetical protein